ncbi:MAG: hypothetical protein ACOYK6_01285 [Chthoniobacterales bacterium]
MATPSSTKWNERLTLLSKNLKVTLPAHSKKAKVRSPLICKESLNLLVMP